MNFNNIMHNYCTGVVYELLATHTNVTPEMTLGTKAVMVCMPINEWQDSGAFVNTAWKTLTQLAVLRRPENPESPVHFIWEDEAHLGVTSRDSAYVNQSRKYNA